MADTLVDRIAQAIGDPGSIVPRRHVTGRVPAESTASWSTRAVLAVLATGQIGSLLERLIDPDDCWFDHHGGCQAHGCTGKRCPHAEAKAVIAMLREVAGATIGGTADQASPAVAVHEVPPIGDILTVEPDDDTAAKVAATGHLYVPGGVYELRTIGDRPTVVITIHTIDGETEDDLIDCAKSDADARGWTVTDYRCEPDRWVLEGARHLNLGGTS